MENLTARTLYLVATPIGNLEDITLRALRVLRGCDLVAAEDTRHTAKLLHHYDIRKPTVSLHDHNEQQKSAELVARLTAGGTIALVSDAGTPAVSDPGFKLVRAAIDAGVRVEAIPGPSAVLAALVASGLPTDAFVFVGFAPPKSRARADWLQSLSGERRTIVLFEAPHRIHDMLADALRVLGDRQVVVARELTKLHEDLVRGPISDVIGRLTETRGEFTVVLAGKSDQQDDASRENISDSAIYENFCRLTESGLERREAITRLASDTGLRSRAVYAAVERARKS